MALNWTKIAIYAVVVGGVSVLAVKTHERPRPPLPAPVVVAPHVEKPVVPAPKVVKPVPAPKAAPKPAPAVKKPVVRPTSCAQVRQKAKEWGYTPATAVAAAVEHGFSTVDVAKLKVCLGNAS